MIICNMENDQKILLGFLICAIVVIIITMIIATIWYNHEIDTFKSICEEKNGIFKSPYYCSIKEGDYYAKYQIKKLDNEEYYLER